MKITVDDSAIDTLTIHFWRDGGYNGKPLPPDAPWMAHIGRNFIEGRGGSGPTPLAALVDLVKNIADDQRHRTDKGVLVLNDERQHQGESQN